MPGSQGYVLVGILIVTLIALVSAIMGATHLIGPKRHGKIKDSTYESGVDPVGDARQRFNVKFYLIAVLFLVFDVEIIFLYPWAVLFPRFRTDAAGWGAEMTAAGFGPEYFLFGIGLFFVLLTVGFVYEWRKGIFQWH